MLLARKFERGIWPPRCNIENEMQDAGWCRFVALMPAKHGYQRYHIEAGCDIGTWTASMCTRMAAWSGLIIRGIPLGLSMRWKYHFNGSYLSLIRCRLQYSDNREKNHRRKSNMCSYNRSHTWSYNMTMYERTRPHESIHEFFDVLLYLLRVTYWIGPCLG